MTTPPRSAREFADSIAYCFFGPQHKGQVGGDFSESLKAALHEYAAIKLEDVVAHGRTIGKEYIDLKFLSEMAQRERSGE